MKWLAVVVLLFSGCASVERADGNGLETRLYVGVLPVVGVTIGNVFFGVGYAERDLSEKP